MKIKVVPCGGEGPDHDRCFSLSVDGVVRVMHESWSVCDALGDTLRIRAAGISTGEYSELDEVADQIMEGK
jgi:hypothetical protein